jgi:hypothetical protein
MGLLFHDTLAPHRLVVGMLSGDIGLPAASVPVSMPNNHVLEPDETASR